MLVILGMTSTLYGPAFMKLGDIKGESQASGHEDEIDILSWSFGIASPVYTDPGTGNREATRPSVSEVSVTKEMDKATPRLMEGCATGTHYPDAVITLKRASADTQQTYLVITMTDVIVTSVSTGGSGGDDRPTETLSLNFGSIQVVYTEYLPDGRAGETTEFMYSLTPEPVK